MCAWDLVVPQALFSFSSRMAGSHSCAQHGRHRSLLHLLGEKAPFPRGELQSSGREWRRATTTGELPHGTPRKLLHGCTSQERQPAGRAPTRLPGGGAEPQPATHRPRVCFLLLAFFGCGDTTCAEWGISAGLSYTAALLA
jgi:hypothetical protein